MDSTGGIVLLFLTGVALLANAVIPAVFFLTAWEIVLFLEVTRG